MKSIILFTFVAAAFLMLLKYPSPAAQALALAMTALLLVGSCLVAACTTRSSYRRSCAVFAGALTLFLSSTAMFEAIYEKSVVTLLRNAHFLTPRIADSLRHPASMAVDQLDQFRWTVRCFTAVIGALAVAFVQNLAVKRRVHWPYMVFATCSLTAAMVWQFTSEALLLWLVEAEPDWFDTIVLVLYGLEPLTLIALFAVVLSVCAGLDRLTIDETPPPRAVWLSSLVCGSLL